MIKRGILIAVLVALVVLILGCQQESKKTQIQTNEPGENKFKNKILPEETRETFINKGDIALEYCKKESKHCSECAFKESPVNITQLIKMGFNCTISNESSVLLFYPCDCEGIVCAPESSTVYYVIGNKMEAIFIIKPFAIIEGPEIKYPFENICLMNATLGKRN